MFLYKVDYVRNFSRHSAYVQLCDLNHSGGTQSLLRSRRSLYPGCLFESCPVEIGDGNLVDLYLEYFPKAVAVAGSVVVADPSCCYCKFDSAAHHLLLLLPR